MAIPHNLRPAPLRVYEGEVNQVDDEEGAAHDGEDDSGYGAWAAGRMAVGCGGDGDGLVAARVLVRVVTTS